MSGAAPEFTLGIYEVEVTELLISGQGEDRNLAASPTHLHHNAAKSVNGT